MQAKRSATAIQTVSGVTQAAVLHRRVERSKQKLSTARRMGRQVVFIVGTPTHNNIGDLAIAYAQAKFLESSDPSISVIPLPFEAVMKPDRDFLSDFIRAGDIITGIGGGNMGDMYLREELCRRKFIQGYPNNQVILFPQTIHFSDSKAGREEFQKTQSLYAAHKNLVVIAREQHSYDVMKKVFKQNKVLFTPDIVLSLNASLIKRLRKGLLICLRDDQEAKIGKSEKAAINEFAKRHFSSVRHTDTISHVPLFNYRRRNKIVENKLDEFRRAQLVITDRLHGMVFAAITGTPCIAMASFNHKVTNTYKWLRHLPYIKFCEDINDLEKLFKQIDLTKTYDYDPIYYDAYWNKIRDAVTRAT